MRAVAPTPVRNAQSKKLLLSAAKKALAKAKKTVAIPKKKKGVTRCLGAAHGVFKAGKGHIVLNHNSPWTNIFAKIYDVYTVFKGGKSKKKK